MGFVAAISMVKDECDVIEATVRAMAAEVDFTLIADNGSTDGTREILAGLADELAALVVVDDAEVGYYQSRKMTALAARACDEGADWVIPFDADERWYSPFGRIADVLAEHPEISIAGALLYDHVPTGADPAEGSPLERMSWRRVTPAPIPKVACRARPAVRIHQGNHGADYGTRLDGLLIARHFPYRSDEQFISKVRNGAAAYRATDLPESEGAHWRGYGLILDASGPEVLVAEVFRRWFWVADPEADASLILDPCP